MTGLYFGLARLDKNGKNFLAPDCIPCPILTMLLAVQSARKRGPQPQDATTELAGGPAFWTCIIINNQERTNDDDDMQHA